MTNWLRLLTDLILPADCDACERPLVAGHTSALCAECRAGIVPPAPPLCDRCGVPIAAGVGCGDCRRRPPTFTTARALGLYLPGHSHSGALARAVHALKYRRRRRVAVALGHLLAEAYPFHEGAILVPVPLHPARLRERGFNQALLLARALGRARSLPVAPRALARTRATAPQPGLGFAGRQENLADAFVVRLPADIDGRRVVLIDDVLTTGATANACAAMLLGAGATRVDVYTVGRAP
jgi:ComF family protein